MDKKQLFDILMRGEIIKVKTSFGTLSFFQNYTGIQSHYRSNNGDTDSNCRIYSTIDEMVNVIFDRQQESKEQEVV